MRDHEFVAMLVLLVSTAAFAQDKMPVSGGGMNQPAMNKPLLETANDLRQVVPLTDAEKAVMATEMRQMLASVQGVADGLARGDMAAVSAAASKSGMVMMEQLPMQIRMKFPEAFSQMAMASHQSFDQIAKDAKTAKQAAPLLKQLADGVQNCIACHATYRFAARQ